MQIELEDRPAQFPFIRVLIKDLFGIITLVKTSNTANGDQYLSQGSAAEIMLTINYDYNAQNPNRIQDKCMIVEVNLMYNCVTELAQYIDNTCAIDLLIKCLSRLDRFYARLDHGINPSDNIRAYPLYQLLENCQTALDRECSWKGFSAKVYFPNQRHSYANAKLQIEFNGELIYESIIGTSNPRNLCKKLMDEMKARTVPETFYAGLPIERIKSARII